jgi:hypothetical protein
MEDEGNTHEMYLTPVPATDGKQKEPPTTNYEQFEPPENRSDDIPVQSGRLRYPEESTQSGRLSENITAGGPMPSARVNMQSDSGEFMPSGRLRE